MKSSFPSTLENPFSHPAPPTVVLHTGHPPSPRFFHPRFPPIFDLPCTVRRFLLLSDDRHSLGRRTREEKELSLSFSLEEEKKKKRQRETRRNVCKRTKEGAARVGRAGAIGRNLLRPEKGTKKGEWKKMRTGRNCDRKEDARAVLRHWFSLLYMRI